MRRDGDPIDDLQIERTRDTVRVVAKQGQQAVVVAASVAEAMTARVEGHSGDQNPVDRIEGERRAMWKRLGNAAG